MMKKITAFLSKPIVIGLLFVMAVGLLLGTGVSGTRAALTYYSPTYQSRLQLSRIGVSLLETGKSFRIATTTPTENGIKPTTTTKTTASCSKACWRKTKLSSLENAIRKC